MSSKKIFFVLLVLLVIFPLVFLIPYSYNYNRSYSSNSTKIELSGNVPKINLSKLPKISYNTLEESWYNQKIEMLIITPNGRQDFVDAVKPLADWNNEKGVKTIILSNFSKYEGKDNATKIRNMIKSYYEKENIQWVLLAGDAENNSIPIRYVYNPDVTEVVGQSEYLNWDDYLKPTDFYYADLTGTWDDNNNGIYGESSEKTGYVDEISWTPEVYVGRFPVDNATELGILVNKTLKYETNPLLGNWMNKMLLAGGISDIVSQEYPDGEDESRLTTYIWQQYTQTIMNFTHLYHSTYYIPPDPKSPLNTTSFRDEFNKGYSTVIFAGHGDPTIFTDANNIDFYDNTDAASSNNTNMPSLVYGDACTTSSYDQGDESIGETLIMSPNAGVIGYIGGLRVTWYFPEDSNLEMLNRGNAKLFWKAFFEDKKFQQGKALYDSKVDYMNSDYFAHGDASMNDEWERKNVLTYCLLGDPEVDIYTDIPVNLSNPFIGKIYEGQLVSITVRDANGNPAPNARINLKSNDGKYKTIYSDQNGNAEFRLLPQANENYYATITGHNVVPSYFHFKTLPDDVIPKLISFNCTPEVPTVSDNIRFNVNAVDSGSGVESVFLLISNNTFADYTYIKLSNNSQENKNIFNATINKLDPGIYSVLIAARDYANNIGILNNNMVKIVIPTPIMDYVLVITLITISCFAGISIYVAFNGIEKYSFTIKKFEKDSLT